MPNVLTDKIVADAIAAGRVVELSDAALPGLRIRIRKRTATWSRLRRQAGQRSRIYLGRWPEMNADEARLACAPPASGAEAHAAFECIVLGDLIDAYRSTKLVHNSTGVEVYRALNSKLAKLLPRDPATIKTAELSWIIVELASRAPCQANRTLSNVKALFNWCHGNGLIEANPAQGIPKPTREKARERTLSLREIATVFSASANLGHPYKHIVQLLIITGCRCSEVSEMRVDELEWGKDEEGGVWNLPSSRSKTRRGTRIPLSPYARQLIEDAIWIRRSQSDYVFDSGGGRPPSGWSRAKSRLDHILELAEEGLEPWRFHDFRRTFATEACERLGARQEVVDRALNHVASNTQSVVLRVYERSTLFNERKKLALAWSKHLVSEVNRYRNGPPPLNTEHNLSSRLTSISSCESSYIALEDRLGRRGRSEFAEEAGEWRMRRRLCLPYEADRFGSSSDGDWLSGPIRDHQVNVELSALMMLAKASRIEITGSVVDSKLILSTRHVVPGEIADFAEALISKVRNG